MRETHRITYNIPTPKHKTDMATDIDTPVLQR